MRTPLTLLTFLLFVLVTSCKKEATTPTTPVDNKEFTLNSVQSVAIAKDSSGKVGFDIAPTSTDTNEYTYELTGLPKEVTFSYTTNIADSKLYGNVHLRGEYPAEGKYDVTLKATNKAGVSKETTFTLNITKEANCHNRMVGVYNDPANGNIQFTRSNSLAGLMIPDMYSKPVEITIDCDKHTFTMYATEVMQTYTSITKTGSGTFNPPNEISYTLTTTRTVFNPTDPGNPHITKSTVEFNGKRK